MQAVRACPALRAVTEIMIMLKAIKQSNALLVEVVLVVALMVVALAVVALAVVALAVALVVVDPHRYPCHMSQRNPSPLQSHPDCLCPYPYRVNRRSAG